MKGEKYFSNHQFKKNGGRLGNREIQKISQREVHVNKGKGTGDLFPPWF